MTISLRAARFADEARAASILNVDSNGAGISALTDITGKDVAIARLEPLLIGSIFPIHGEDRIVVTPQQVPPLLPAEGKRGAPCPGECNVSGKKGELLHPGTHLRA